MRSTHTYAILEISPAAHKEIAEKLRQAGYHHIFHEDGAIDMQGIAVKAPEPTDPFFCGLCLESSGSDVRPDVCPHCKAGLCQGCGTRLKAGSRWCCGCGKIEPEIRPSMFRSSSFGGAYATHNWEIDGLRKGATSMFRVWGHSMTGEFACLVEESINPETNPSTILNSRELTPDELKVFGYVSQAEWIEILRGKKKK